MHGLYDACQMMFFRCVKLRSLHTGLLQLSSADAAVRSGASDYGLHSSDLQQHIPLAASNTSTASPRRVYFLNNRDPNQVISFSEALRCLRAYSLLPSPETVELSLNVNMTLKKNKKKEQFRGTLVYPHRFGHEQKILVVAEDEFLSKVEVADMSGNANIITKLEKSAQELDFDVCVCTPTMYEKMKHLQRTLRAKMPNPRRGTVVPPDELREAVVSFQQSKPFRCSKFGTINNAVGKLDFSDSELRENVKCLVDSVAENRGTLSKAMFLTRATLSTNFGPGFDIALQEFLT